MSKKEVINEPKILIANRGEIAVRIIRACKELGIPCVSVYSIADKDSLHVKLADESICIGGNLSKDSYLNMQNVISAAISTGCNYIHPGYGFLSENEKFVEMVEDCGITFIGPTADAIANLGNKSKARAIALKNNVPIVAGSDGICSSVSEAIKIGKKIGYPILLKASSGGGGRGISIINKESDLKRLFEQTAMEAEANFGNSNLYIEKYIENPRHIEVQIIGDEHHNIVHLFERDCSMQRRNQKIIEEAPSNFITPSLRTKLGQAAVKLAKAINYKSLGTVEFLVDKNLDFYFIEMNTRIQVEHPVTEMITGIDLLKEQIKVALGEPLSFKQRDIKINGFALECRINAEDPLRDFMPQPGRINRILFPGGFGVRIDSHMYPDYSIPPFYDSLLGKLITHGKTREEAISKMKMAIEQFIIEGVQTNLEYLYSIIHHPDFMNGNYDTSFVAKFNSLYKSEQNHELD